MKKIFFTFVNFWINSLILWISKNVVGFKTKCPRVKKRMIFILDLDRPEWQKSLVFDRKKHSENSISLTI